MGNPFKKVRPGQKLEIPAEAFNTFIDAALDFKARQRNVDQRSEPARLSTTVIKVRNQSGSDRLRFEVLGLDGPIIGPDENQESFQNELAFNGVVPQAGAHRGKFAILLEPVAADAIAHRACVAGVTVALVRISDPGHQYADIAPDACEYLESCESGGALILWKHQDEGVTWALVHLGPVPEDICRFRLTARLDRCGSAWAERIISGGAQGSGSSAPDWCQSDRDIEVVDSLGLVPPEGLPAGAFGWAKWMADSRSWEVLYYGEGCCGSSSSSSPSSSSSSSVESSASESSPPSGSSSSESLFSSESSLSKSSVSQSSVSSASKSSASGSLQSSQSSTPSESAPSESGPPSSMPSESPTSESAPSGSAPSESGPPSSAPSESAPSSAPSESAPPSAPSESAPPPSSAPSESAPPPPSGPSESAPPPSWGSDKSTAIVPASWAPGGYTALFTLESPEVLFEDILLARIPQKAATLQIDPRFVEVCEPRSLVVSGCVPNVPVVVGASVEGSLVHVRFAVENETQTVQLVLRLTGVRRGFAGLRFPNRSRRQFQANEAFINSAYPAE